MNSVLETDEKDALSRFYSTLEDTLKLKKKYKEGSVLLSMMGIKSNDAYKMLDEASIPQSYIRKKVFDRLDAGGYIQLVDKPGYYSITAQGVWEVETNGEKISVAKLIEQVGKKYFELFNNDVFLTEKEKVILLSMIAVRSFSSESCLNLKRDDGVLDKLEEVIIAAFELMEKHGIVSKLSKNELFGLRGNEHPVSNLIRHTDLLLKKTKGIYKTLGKQQYFLDLSAEGQLSLSGLQFLMEMIFTDKMTLAMKEDTEKYCNSSSYSASIYLFDLSTHIFAKPQYDAFISTVLNHCYAANH